MTELKIRRIAGWGAVAMVLLWMAQFPLYRKGDPSVSFYDGPAMAQEASRLHNVILTRVLLDLGLYVAAMVFAAALSHLIRRADPAYEWAATLVFGSMAVWVGVTLVANGLEGASALDALGGNPDPSAARTLTMGTILIYNSSIAFAITGLFLGAAGYATASTGVLPRWSRWVAYTGAVLCAAGVPSMYGGAVDVTSFYNPGGWGPVVIANFPPAIWIVLAAVVLLRAPQPAPGRRQ
ncbi:hypothetical protein ACX9NE_05025 [Mycobacterium sp. ML4]